MKTLLKIAIIMLAVSVQASPYLVCDPQAGIDTYTIYQDGVEIASDVPAEPDGSLKYDLTGVTPGVYSFEINACNGWVCGPMSILVSDEPTHGPAKHSPESTSKLAPCAGHTRLSC